MHERYIVEGAQKMVAEMVRFAIQDYRKGCSDAEDFLRNRGGCLSGWLDIAGLDAKVCIHQIWRELDWVCPNNQK